MAWDWESWLGSLGRFGVKLGLERMTCLLDRLGSPQQGIPVIHVAGTNGKGSVCAVLSEILWRSGYRVGRYTSPHLVAWQERIWVNGHPIGTTDWENSLAQVAEVVQHYPPGVDLPTQFDVTTATAWVYFQQQQVEVVVLEVGLGGRLDSTNAAIDTQVAVITSIGRDHWQRLGDSLPAIASEKAGIIKPGIPTVVAPQVPEVMTVLEQTAAYQGSRLLVATPAVDQVASGEQRQIRWQDQIYDLGLVGPVQQINMGVALTVVQVLRSLGWRIEEKAVREGLAQTHWPGRCQQREFNGTRIWLDGAHNQPAAVSLRQFVDQRFGPQAVQWVVGILDTKDAEGILAALLRPGDRLCAVGIPDHASFDPLELVRMAHCHQPQLQHGTTLTSLDTFPHWLTGVRDPVVVCGSLYLIGHLLALAQSAPTPAIAVTG
ncbi:MAG: folylpolyglutamate synthase/dihydrofolate synthase family protein [Synechococcales cyanobacterium]